MSCDGPNFAPEHNHVVQAAFEAANRVDQFKDARQLHADLNPEYVDAQACIHFKEVPKCTFLSPSLLELSSSRNSL